KDLIKDEKNGFITKLNEKDLARGILKGMREGEKMKANCLKFAKDYDWDKMIGKVERVYK
ncbi:glycosyltransferase family 1 protein, partial [Patescibacteria group bacterium]|nr:glycosyltransferase family 1 protein [Patescibacteria group bacterium]